MNKIINKYIFVFLCLTIFSSTILAQNFRFSEGLYRIPYANGTTINMSSDVWSHNPLGKYDMSATVANTQIVAAADGWVRGIQESFDTACFTVVNNVVTCCWQLNNYVIIEHPNGEWSGYTHIQVNTATNAGISLNQWVTAGTPLGLEGTVGCSTGNHLHFEVSRPSDPNNGFQVSGGFLRGELLTPVICGTGTGNDWFEAGQSYTAGSCSDNCSTTVTVTENLGGNDVDVYRADNLVRTSLITPPTFFNGSESQMRSGGYILLRPGSQIRAGSKFEALIKSCNEDG